MKSSNAVAAVICTAVLGIAVSCTTERQASNLPKTDTPSIPAPATPPLPPTLPKDTVTAARWNEKTTLIGVGLGVDGRLIALRFRMEPREARRLQQGNVYVIDETSNCVYREVPVMPKLGPLISRPATAGQTGYVMLVNAPTRLNPGAVVTVVLGKYKQKHVLVQ